MTTIAYRAGVLAGDSQATDDQIWRVDKVLRLDTEAGELLMGFCGDVHSAMVFAEWLKDQKCRRPDIGHEEFEAMVVGSTGRVTIWNWSLVPMNPKGKFFAIGSGGAAAMGAMHAGKSAAEAVAIACKVDPYTAAPVKVLRLKTAPIRRAKPKG